MFKVAAKLDGSSVLWEPGCPIVLEAAQVARDAEANVAFLQVRVENIGATVVSYLKLSAAFVLSSGERESRDFEYFDLALNPGASEPLGAQPLSVVNIVGIEATVASVKAEELQWGAKGGGILLPDRLPLSLSTVQREERRRQFEEQGLPVEASNYATVEAEAYWVCACGQVNVGRDDCCKCGASRAFLKATEDPEKLEHDAEQHAAEERSVAAAKQAKAAKTKRALKIAVPIAAAFVVIAVAVYVVVSVVLPQNAYNSAVASYEAGNYAEAYDELSAMGSYNNAQELAGRAAYYAGEAAMGQGDFQEAIRWFEIWGSEDKVNEAKYAYSEAHSESPDETTQEYLRDLIDAQYKGARELFFEIADCQVEIKVVAVGADAEHPSGNLADMPDLGRSFSWDLPEAKPGGVAFAYRIQSNIPLEDDDMLCEVETADGHVVVGGYVGKSSTSDDYEVELSEPDENGWRLQYVPVSTSLYKTYRVDFSVTQRGNADEVSETASVFINHPEFEGLEYED